MAIDVIDEVQRTAKALYDQKPDWVRFYREILGVRGTMRRHFPTREAIDEFEQTDAYRDIQRMLKSLRERPPVPEDPEGEPTQIITVRLPKSMHDALRVEAHEHHVSVNKLCISKLLQFIQRGLVPGED